MSMCVYYLFASVCVEYIDNTHYIPRTYLYYTLKTKHTDTKQNLHKHVIYKESTLNSSHTQSTLHRWRSFRQWESISAKYVVASKRVVHTEPAHPAVMFEIVHRCGQLRGWLDAFIAIMEGKVDLVGSPEHRSSKLMSLVDNACNAAIEREATGKHYAPVCWWNEKIEELRHQCHCTRRKERSRVLWSYVEMASRGTRNSEITLNNGKRRT